MSEKLTDRLRRYSEACVAYKLDADFADAVQQAIEELSKRSECPCWYGGIRFCSMLGKPIPEPPKEESNGV